MSAGENDGGDAPVAEPARSDFEGWMPPAGAPVNPASTGHERSAWAGWTVVAVVLGGLAAVSCVLLFVPAWSATLGPWVTVALALASIAAGIVVLERRRGRSGWGVGAVAVAGVAGVVATAGALPQPNLEVHVYGYADCLLLTGTPPADINAEAYRSAFYAPAFVGKQTFTADPLPFGATIAVSATADEGAQELATFTVGDPVDVTDQAAAASVAAPAGGVYLAVPVTMEAVNEGAFACFDWSAPPSSWFDAAGGAAEYTTVSIPGYPTVEGGGVDNGDGTFTYYDIFDVKPGPAENGGYELDLLEPDGTIKPVYWGDAP